MEENQDFFPETDADIEGQLSMFGDEQENYLPVATDYAKIPNMFIDRLGNISYLADLGLKAAIQVVGERSHEMYDGTAEGLYYKKLYSEMGTDFAEGLVAELPINKFISCYGLNSGGSTYNSLAKLYTGDQLRNQWQILVETEEGGGGTTVLTGTWYSRTTGRLYMKFNPDLKEKLVEIKKDFARLSLPVLGKLRIEYISELYQRLKKALDLEQARNSKFGNAPVREIREEYDLDYLYFMLGLYPIDLLSNDPDMKKVVSAIKSRNYTAAATIFRETDLLSRFAQDKSRKKAIESFAYFRRAFLDRAFGKINGFPTPKNLEKYDPDTGKYKEAYEEYTSLCKDKYPTDIHFRYSLIRTGIGGKVSGIVFYVSKAREDYVEEADTPEDDIKDAAEQAPMPELTFEQMNFLLEIKNSITEELTPKEFLSIAVAARWDKSRIEKAYEVAKASTTPIRNLSRYLVKAIEEEWEPPTPKDLSSEEEYSLAFLKKTCGFDDLAIMRPDLSSIGEQFLTIIYDTMNSDATKYKIGQAFVPAKMVKDRILSLNAFNLIYSIETFLSAPGENRIVSPAYILTLLYNSEAQSELEIQWKLENRQ